MFRLNLKIAWRNLCKNKGYTFINILGLSIGMASCILIFIFIRYQLSFDEGFRNEDRIFRVVTDWKYDAYDDYSAGVPIPLITVARDEIPGLEKTAAIAKRGEIVHVNNDSGKEVIKSDEAVYYTEPDFFAIFKTEWLLGNPLQALSQPNTAALSKATAQKYFGTIQNSIGKSIVLGSSKIVKVTGVFSDMPQNSSFPLKIVVSYRSFSKIDNECWDCVSSGDEFFILLKNGLTSNDLKEPLAKFNKKHYTDKKIAGNQNNHLQALKDIHFSDRYANFAESNVSKDELFGLVIIGLFLVITACINFINLSTAQAINRAKEVGVRKVMGGQRKQLVFQFLTETLVVTSIAMLIACMLSEIAIPGMESLFHHRTSFSLMQHPIILVFILSLVVIVAFLAGFYPAMIMSGFKPALAIKNKITLNTGGLSLRKFLVVLQFTISIILIICTITVLWQMRYVQRKSLGFKAGQVLMVNMPTDSLNLIKQNTFKERVTKLKGIEMVSYCQGPPLSPNINSSNFTFNGIKNNDFEIRRLAADENYFKLFDLKIIAGRIYSKSDTANGYIVNETFLKKTNITNPANAIGKIINSNGQNLPIVGVVKDFNDKSLKESISGLSISAGKNQYYRVAIKIDGNELVSTGRKVEALWNNIFPEQIYYSTFVNENINSLYESEYVMQTLFKVFTGIIIFISFIGLFGLMSFVATQRTREMAIRKVLGATTFQLIKMLNLSFLLIVFVANLVAWPLAYLFVEKWLSTFAYRMEISIWPFVLAMLITMLTTLITVTLRSYKAAKANAVDALKYE